MDTSRGGPTASAFFLLRLGAPAEKSTKKKGDRRGVARRWRVPGYFDYQSGRNTNSLALRYVFRQFPTDSQNNRQRQLQWHFYADLLIGSTGNRFINHANAYRGFVPARAACKESTTLGRFCGSPIIWPAGLWRMLLTNADACRNLRDSDLAI